MSFSFDTFGLDDSQDDSPLFFETSAITQLMEEGQYTEDLFRNFRFSLPSKLSSFVWSKPNSTKEDKANEIPITGRVIKGIRGYIPHVRSGLMFYISEGNGRVVCTSTSATVKLTDEVSSTHRDPMPVPVVLYSPVQYKSEEQKATDEAAGIGNQPSADVIKYQLTGSQKPNLSCADCVLSGMNTKTYTSSGKEQTDSCAGSTQVVFMVESFAVETTDWATSTTTVEWIHYRDMTIHPDSSVKLYEEPPTIVISMSKGVSAAKSTSKLQLNYGTFAKEGYETFSTFLRGAKKRYAPLSADGFRHQLAGKVEMVMTTPEGPDANPLITSMPVFKILPDEPNLHRRMRGVNNYFIKVFKDLGGSFAADGRTPTSSGSFQFDDAPALTGSTEAATLPAAAPLQIAATMPVPEKAVAAKKSTATKKAAVEPEADTQAFVEPFSEPEENVASVQAQANALFT